MYNTDLEIQILNAALDEADELRHALNNRIEYLEKRCALLEELLLEYRIPFEHIERKLWEED